MVILEHDPIVERKTVIRPAAHTHGVFLQGAQAGRGLARIEDAGLRTAHRLNIASGERGNPTHALEQIQGHALAAEQTTSRAGCRRNRRPGLGVGTLRQQSAQL